MPLLDLDSCIHLLIIKIGNSCQIDYLSVNCTSLCPHICRSLTSFSHDDQFQLPLTVMIPLFLLFYWHQEPKVTGESHNFKCSGTLTMSPDKIVPFIETEPKILKPIFEGTGSTNSPKTHDHSPTDSDTHCTTQRCQSNVVG